MTLEQAYTLGMTVAPSLSSSVSPAASAPQAAAARVDSAGGSLTPREREIVALVATGRTNRQIADTLVLSGRTVETHVRNILGKLELSSRAQIAVWAVEHGLGASGRT